MANDFKAGVYRHYKGKFYLALGVARHTETDEELVVYVPLYAHPDGGKALQCRPLKMWNEVVAEEGTGFPRGRFEHIGDVPKKGVS